MTGHKLQMQIERDGNEVSDRAEWIVREKSAEMKSARVKMDDK